MPTFDHCPQALTAVTPTLALALRPIRALVEAEGWFRLLILPIPTVSADTEVVGGDGQHHPHLGPGSRLLLPPTNLHQPHHLQVSSLGRDWQAGSLAALPSHFCLPFWCAPSPGEGLSIPALGGMFWKVDLLGAPCSIWEGGSSSAFLVVVWRRVSLG